MQLERVNQYVRDNDILKYDVLYVSNGARKQAYTLLDAKEKDPYKILKQAHEMFRPEKLLFVPRKKNGNSTRTLPEITIDVTEAPAVPAVSKELPTAPPSLQGLNGIGEMPQNSGAYGSFLGQLNEYKYIVEKERRERAETDLERIKSDYERLKEEHAQIKQDLSLKDKEFELAMREKQSENSNTLNGFVGSLKDPDTLQGIANALTAFQALKTGAQAPQQIQQTGAALPEGITTEMIHDVIIKDVIGFLANQSEPDKQAIHQLIMLAATKKINANKIVSKFQPQMQPQPQADGAYNY